MHILPQGKCCYRPQFKSFRKWQCTIYGWVRYLSDTFARNAKLINHLEGIFRRCVRHLRRLSTPAEFIHKFDEASAVPIILCCSPAIFPGLLKHFFLFLSAQSSSVVMYAVWISATSQISSANVTSRRPPILRRGFLQIFSMRNHQRQGHTPPPGAVSSCFPRRLLPIGTLFYRHYGWLTETLSWTTTYLSFLDVSHLFPTFLIVPVLYFLLT